MRNQKGSIILEALIAVGIGALFFTAIGSALVTSYRSTGSIFKSAQADWALQEAVSAVRSIDFANLSATSSAQISFNTGDGAWSIAPGEAESLEGGLTRSIAIREVQRDAQCLIVESGGTVDPDSYYLDTTISWDSVTGTAKTMTGTTLVTNWENPTGPCFVPEDAGVVSVDTTGAYWGGSKQLRGVTLINESSESVTVTAVTMTWGLPSSGMTQLFLIDNKAWSTSGPGLPGGIQYSGSRIDILDTELPAGDSADAYKIQFTDAMSGAGVQIEFEFADGSTLLTDEFFPI